MILQKELTNLSIDLNLRISKLIEELAQEICASHNWFFKDATDKLVIHYKKLINGGERIVFCEKATSQELFPQLQTSYKNNKLNIKLISAKTIFQEK